MPSLGKVIMACSTLLGVGSAFSPWSFSNTEPCGNEPAGAGPAVNNPDTVLVFKNFEQFHSIAVNAPDVDGFDQISEDLSASPESPGYQGFMTMTSYDPSACGKFCNSVSGCNAFTTFFIRLPSTAPAQSCPDGLPSTTGIYCAIWSQRINPREINNRGEWRWDFHVIIVGGNAYNRSPVSSSSTTSSSTSSTTSFTSSSSSSSSSSIVSTTSTDIVDTGNQGANAGGISVGTGNDAVTGNTGSPAKIGGDNVNAGGTNVGTGGA